MNELEQKKQILEDSWQQLLEQVDLEARFIPTKGPPCYPFTDRLQRCILQSDQEIKQIAADMGCSYDYIKAIRTSKNRRRLGC